MSWFSNFGMSEWLITCAAVLFIVVMVDGFRRMRAERRQDLKWDLQLAKDFPESEDPLSDEMFESDYRVVRRGKGQTISNSSEHANTDANLQASLSGFNANTDDHAPLENFQSPASSPLNGESGEDYSIEYSLEEQLPSHDEKDQSAINVDQELKIISLHVRSAASQSFVGSDVVQVLLACNMKYGETNILHRYSDTTVKGGPIDFSVANMLEPGTFDLDNLSNFNTPGVTFFMALPGPKDPLAVFNMMVETARCVAETLGGVLLDDEHSTATPQVLNHYRDQIRQLVVERAHRDQSASKAVYAD